MFCLDLISFISSTPGDVAKFNIKNQRTGGVLLKFDPPFKDIPSIIVSPRLSKEATLSRYSLDVVQIPHVVVEVRTTHVVICQR